MRHLFAAALIVVGGSLFLAPLVAYHMSRSAYQDRVVTILGQSANEKDFALRISSFKTNGGNEPHIYDAWAGFYYLGGVMLVVIGIVVFVVTISTGTRDSPN